MGKEEKARDTARQERKINRFRIFKAVLAFVFSPFIVACMCATEAYESNKWFWEIKN